MKDCGTGSSMVKQNKKVIKMIVVKLYSIPNFVQLKDEVLSFINSVNSEHNQIMCQNLFDEDDYITGIGKLDTLEIQNERQYKHVQKRLKGTLIEKLILQHNAYRTRIIILPPKTCYSIHHDLSPRLHVPIVSNEQNWMIWPQHSQCEHLSPGSVYYTDTRLPHTFINGDNTLKRIHLIMSVNKLG